MEHELRYAVAPITHVEVRDTSATEDNTWTMSGYAAVFDQDTIMYDSKFLQLTESIDSGAFDHVLREQPLDGAAGVVHFNFGHDMNRAVASTDVPAGQPGSLQLNADKHGLHFMAKVPRDDPDGIAMAAKMRSGVLKQASFAFTVAESEYVTREEDDGPDVEHRTILELKHLYDVCAVAQGAYSQTVAGLRSYAAALGQPEREASTVSPIEGGGSAVSPTEGSGVDPKKPTAEALEAFRRNVEQKRRLRSGFPSRKAS